MDLAPFSGDLADIDFLSLLLVDLSGGLRSVALPRSYARESVLAKGIGFDAANYGYTPVEGGDLTAIPDLSTAFVEEKEGFSTLHAFCDVVSAGLPFDQYPRTVARKAMDRLRETGLASDALMLVELEFYAFEEARWSTRTGHSYYFVGSSEGIGEEAEDAPRFGPSSGYHRLAPEDRYALLRNRAVAAMEEAGVPVKYHHHESGASQLEIELDFASLSRAGDLVALAKWILKSVAAELGLFVTFMPKPMAGMAGSGMHVHQYLEREGASAFPGEGPFSLSPLALSYAAGILEHSLSGSLLLTNPSSNSYRRLAPGFSAPVSATLSSGSKEAALRVPRYLGAGEARLEYRTGDGTANPWYYLAALLLAGLDGLSRRLDPVAAGYANEEDAAARALPAGLLQSLEGLARDRAWLAPAFPDSLVDSWIAAKRKEADYVNAAPVPQEYELYF